MINDSNWLMEIFSFFFGSFRKACLSGKKRYDAFDVFQSKLANVAQMMDSKVNI